MSKDYLASGNKKVKIGEASVTIKKLSYGDTKQFVGNVDENNIDIANIDNMILSSVEDWDLTDEDDNKLSLSKESLDKLTTSFVNQLSQEILSFNNLGVEEGKNFPRR